MRRLTKLICTIGPSCSDEATIGRMIDAGVDIFRINFSFGDRKTHGEEVRKIRKQARAKDRIIGILQDLPGPKVRIGKIRDGAVSLAQGNEFVLTTKNVLGDSTRATVRSPEILSSLKRGSTLFLADGEIELEVKKIEGDKMRCAVISGGILSTGKGLNAPGANLGFRVPTDADVAHLAYGLELGVDFVALSFVRNSSDIRSVRKIVAKKGKEVFLIAKIEQREAVENFDWLIREADGFMVARGDLGIEMPLEQIPLVQKRIIRRCNEAGKPVTVATQMLDSMVYSLVPTRAEVTDISNAILDGADSLMLSDETAAGKHPVETVATLAKVARATDSGFRGGFVDQSGTKEGVEEAVGHAACSLAGYIGASAIVAPTQSGATVRRIAKYRPNLPVVAMCVDPKVARTLTIFRSVVPRMTERTKRIDELFERAEGVAARLGLARKGERIVVTSGKPEVRGSTDFVKVQTISRDWATQARG